MRRCHEILWVAAMGVVGCGDDGGASASTTGDTTTIPDATTMDPTPSTSTGETPTSTGELPTTTGDVTTGDVTTGRSCGDGVVQDPEPCDDGDMVDEDACTSACAVYFPPLCPAPADYIVCDDGLDLADKSDPRQVLAAIGVCDDIGSNSVLVSSYTLDAPDTTSWQVARGFGSHTHDADQDPNTPDTLLYAPREGATMLMISTGRISAPDGAGVVVEADNSQPSNGPNDNSDNPNQLPDPLRDDVGSNQGAGGTPFSQCDGVNDCSDGLYKQWNELGGADPNDRLFFKFTAPVPLTAHGFRFSLAFCTSEWPVYVGSMYNDIFIGWQSDPSPDAYTGNVVYIDDPDDPDGGLPITATSLDDHFKTTGYALDDPELAGTGFDSHACTDWQTVRGQVQPGALITIGFFLSDMGDDNLGTQVLLDNFRWDCDGCGPGPNGGCGIQEL